VIFLKKIIKQIPSLNKNKEGIFIFLNKTCNIYPNKISYYNTAFTHKTQNKTNNYERLEFLGDSILNMTVSEYLFLEHKNIEEGELSKKRSIIIGRKNLNKIGKELILENLIKHNLKSLSKNIYGNVLESLIGAIYLDLGYKTSQTFIKKFIIPPRNTDLFDHNYKSKILEWSQKNKKQIKFVNTKQKGPDHQKQYLIELHINGDKVSESWGKTIKSAEQKSSKIVINIVN
tara:strand:- start:3025 stop:3717 length:693 start_codon:yes stop_codon:yes gene_type:complete